MRGEVEGERSREADDFASDGYWQMLHKRDNAADKGCLQHTYVRTGVLGIVVIEGAEIWSDDCRSEAN